MLDWKSLHEAEFQKPYFKDLKAFLTQEIEMGQTIYPEPKNLFKAFDLCPWERTKVVLLGQDPYHGPGQAQGLSFSVPKGVKVPPSLKNIYKELETDVGFEIPEHGNLEAWAQQGVLLLNSTLSVRAKSPTSHTGKGWETFTDHIIKTLSAEKEGLVFLLWGNFAQSKKPLINTHKHLVLEAAHPSPLSAHRGFLGCRHFSKTNDWLQKNGQPAINWQI